MTIGDTSDTYNAVSLARFDGYVLPKKPESLYESKIFRQAGGVVQMPKALSQSRARRLFHQAWRCFSAGSRAIWRLIRCIAWVVMHPLAYWRHGIPPNLGAKMSLSDVLTHTPDKRRLGTRASINIWEVPFQNVILVSQVDGPCDTRNLDEQLAPLVTLKVTKQLSGYLDPSRDLRVRCMTAPRMDIADKTEVRAFIGRTIYAPDGDVTPIGWVRFSSRDPRVYEPLLPDSSPAGIYADQHALGFGVGDPSLPANLPVTIGEDPTGIWLTITGALEVSNVSDKPGVRPLLLANHSLPEAGFGLSLEPTREAISDPIIDASYRLRLRKPDGEAVTGRLDVSLDARPSRLHYAPPSDDSVTLQEIRIQQNLLPKGTRNLWLNLDANQNLVFSEMQATRFAISWHTDIGAARYTDWKRMKTRKQPGRIAWSVRQENDTIVFARTERDPIGYLAPVPMDRGVTFGPSCQGSSVYALDWLNASGGLRLADRSIGLAEAFNKGSSEDCPLLTGERNSQLTASQTGPLRLLRGGDA